MAVHEAAAVRAAALGGGLALLGLVSACGGASACVWEAHEPDEAPAHTEPAPADEGSPTCFRFEVRVPEGFQEVSDRGTEGAWARPTDGLLVELRWNVPWPLRACWRRGERVSGCRSAEVVARATDRRLRLHLERLASDRDEPVELVLDWTAPADLPAGVAPRLLLALTDACHEAPLALWRGPLPHAGQRWTVLRLEPPARPPAPAGR